MNIKRLNPRELDTTNSVVTSPKGNFFPEVIDTVTGTEARIQITFLASIW